MVEDCCCEYETVNHLNEEVLYPALQELVKTPFFRYFKWGQNLTLLYDRVLRYPDRVRNLYFAFLFVLRAVTKTADYLGQAEYSTGNPTEDLKAHSLIKQLLYNPKFHQSDDS